MAKFILLLPILSVLMVFGHCQSDGGIKFQKVSITCSGRMATVEEIQANFHIVEKLLVGWDDWTIALLDGGKLEGKRYGGKVEEGDFSKQVEDNIIGEKIITIESQKKEIKEKKETREVKKTSQVVPGLKRTILSQQYSRGNSTFVLVFEEDCCIDRFDYCMCRESGESWYCDSVSSWDLYGCKNCTCSNGEVNITGDHCPPLAEPHWGNWGPWTRWSSCSATCGPGTKTRQRRCRGGRAGWELHCKGEDTQTKPCRRRPCVYGKLQCECIDAPLCPCEVKCDGACFDQVGPDDTGRCFSYIHCVQQK